MAPEELPALGCRFEFQSDQRSENKLKTITDDLVLDFSFIFKCTAKLAASMNYQRCLPYPLSIMRVSTLTHDQCLLLQIHSSLLDNKR